MRRTLLTIAAALLVATPRAEAQTYADVNLTWPDVHLNLVNQFAATSVLDSGVLMYCQPIHITKAGTLGAVTFRLSTVSGAQPLRVSYRSSNTSSGNHRPLTTNDQYVDVASPASTTTYTVTPTDDGTGGGTKRSVAVGDIVWVCIGWQSTAGTSVAIFRNINSGFYPTINRYAYQYVDTNFYYDHVAQLGLAVQYDDSSYVSHLPSDVLPIIGGSETNLKSNTTPDEVGNVFVAPVGARVYGALVRVASGGFDIIASLYDSTDTLLASRQLNHRYMDGSAWIVPFVFTSAATLTAGETYRITIRPVGTSTEELYYYTNTYLDMGGLTGGDDCKMTQRTNQTGSWTDTADVRVQIQLLINGIEQGGGSSEHAHPILAKAGQDLDYWTRGILRDSNTGAARAPSRTR